MYVYEYVVPLICHQNREQGFPQKTKQQEIKFIVGDNQALMRLGKDVTFLFTYLELDITSIFITCQK